MKMDIHDLRSNISKQIAQAVGEGGNEISTERGDLFERYMGEPYGDEVKHRSSVVSTDVSDTIEWILPELMEIFTSGERVVEFEPEGPEDEDAAEQETDAVNYVFYRQNDGWLALYSAIKDGLIQKNGYVKRIWEERERVAVEEYKGLTEEAVAILLQDWAKEDAEVEFLREEQTTDEQGAVVMDIEARVTWTDKRLTVVPIPPEEMLVAPKWNSIFLDGCPFVAHKRGVTVSDLIEMGYDRKQVEALPDADDTLTTDEAIERFNTQGSFENDPEAMDLSMREVLVHECYVRTDFDGDGKAELRRVMVGGGGHEILLKDGVPDNEEVEVIPFSSWSPVLIPHRHYGRSVAELITDLQRIKTILFRNLLDNIYHSNNPTREIAEGGIGESTLSDLLVDRPGKIIRTRAPGHYTEHQPPQFIGQLLPAIEYVDSVRETRTGVSKYTQGMDAETLNKTATGISKIMTAGQKKVQLIARICAETLLRHLFTGIHGDLRRNSAKQLTLRLREEYVTVDPRAWRNRADLSVSVGLGTGDKDARMQHLALIIQEQKEHLLAGSPLVTMDNLFNSYEKFTENAGFKNARMFFTPPDPGAEAPQPQQQGADPTAGLAQAEAMKAQLQAQSAQQKLEVELYKCKLEDDRERDKTNIDAALRIAEMRAKGETAVTIEQIKALNQRPVAAGGNGMPQ